jgi:hypothetical protein
MQFLRRAKRPASDREWIRLQAWLDALIADPGDERPMADPFREDWMRIWHAEGLTPEEWAARNAQDLLCFSGGEYRYADPAVNRWVQRLVAILFTDEAVDACRRHS